MESAKSVVTSKFQTTIPKSIRDNMNLSVSDTLDWEIENDKIVVRTIKNNFLTYKNTIKTGPGSIDDDIVLARKLRFTLHSTTAFTCNITVIAHQFFEPLMKIFPYESD